MIKGASVSAMVDLEQQETAPNTVNMSSKKELLSSALKRTSEWFASYSFFLSIFFFFFLNSFCFTGFSPRRSQAMLQFTLEELPLPCIRCYPISTP
jgi:hypothetical protein